MNIKKIVKEIKRGNNPIVLKDVVDGVTYYHTIMYVQLNDRQITTTVWGVDARLSEHLQNNRAEIIKSLTDVAFDNFRRYNITPMVVDNVNMAYEIIDVLIMHIQEIGGLDTYTAKVKISA